MEKNTDKPEYFGHWRAPREKWMNFNPVWHKGGLWWPNQTNDRDIIAEATPTIDLTTITTPFGLLDYVYGPGTQAALQAHGGPYEIYEGMEIGWKEVRHLYGDTTSITYRVKPAPKREKVVRDDLFITPNGCISSSPTREPRPVTATFTIIDGKIDLASYRLEAR